MDHENEKNSKSDDHSMNEKIRNKNNLDDKLEEQIRTAEYLKDILDAAEKYNTLLELTNSQHLMNLMNHVENLSEESIALIFDLYDKAKNLAFGRDYVKYDVDLNIETEYGNFKVKGTIKEYYDGFTNKDLLEIVNMALKYYIYRDEFLSSFSGYLLNELEENKIFNNMLRDVKDKFLKVHEYFNNVQAANIDPNSPNLMDEVEKVLRAHDNYFGNKYDDLIKQNKDMNKDMKEK